MKKIAVVTSTRAEYGLLSSVIKKMQREVDIEICVDVTGTHLSDEYGLTVREIEQDGVNINKKINILSNRDDEIGISETMANALKMFTERFITYKPDAIMLLGDRYEILAVAIAALNCRIPVIHLHGGEATEGAADEYIRNAITKLSYLHFASTETYRSRIIQMGEDPGRVFNVGALGVENCTNTELLTKEELEDSISCKLDKFAILTFHPVTLENGTVIRQIEELMEAISEYTDITFVCTKANADQGGQYVNEKLSKYADNYPHIKLYDSLGMKRYLSAVKYSQFVIGNSSSGIIEVPSFHVPTINIGDRQRGRIQASSIINCLPDRSDISNAIKKALNHEFRNNLNSIKNPYYKEGTSDEIVRITKAFLLGKESDYKKHFYDIKY